MYIKYTCIPLYTRVFHVYHRSCVHCRGLLGCGQPTGVGHCGSQLSEQPTCSIPGGYKINWTKRGTNALPRSVYTKKIMVQIGAADSFIDKLKYFVMNGRQRQAQIGQQQGGNYACPCGVSSNCHSD